MKSFNVMSNSFFGAILHIFLRTQTASSASREFHFVSATFINGDEIGRISLPSRILCFAQCARGCGAIRYGEGTDECVLYSEVLLLTDDADVPSSDDNAKTYRKVSPMDSRYLVVFSGSIRKSWDEALAICQRLSSGLATIRDQQDLDDIETAVTKTRLSEETVDCMQRAWLGGKREGGVWKWYTGEPVEDSWSFWGLGQPDSDGDATMRLMLSYDQWLKVNDSDKRKFCAFICE